MSQLCDGRAEMVAQLEMTRQAVLDGLRIQYGRPPLAVSTAAAAAAGPGAPGAAPEPSLDRRGGRLEIGGVVVGSWAGSSGRGRGRGRGGGGGVGGMLVPAGMHHHREMYGRSGMPQIPAGRSYTPSGRVGKKPQVSRSGVGWDGVM